MVVVSLSTMVICAGDIVRFFAAMDADITDGINFEETPNYLPIEVNLREYPFVPISRTITTRPEVSTSPETPLVTIPSLVIGGENEDDVGITRQVYYRQLNDVDLIADNLIAIAVPEFDPINFPLTPQYYVVERDLSEFKVGRNTHLRLLDDCQVTITDNKDNTLLEVAGVSVQCVAANFAEVVHGHCRVYCDSVVRANIKGTLVIDWYNEVLDMPERWVVLEATTVVGPDTLRSSSMQLVCSFCEKLTLFDLTTYMGHLLYCHGIMPNGEMVDDPTT